MLMPGGVITNTALNCCEGNLEKHIHGAQSILSKNHPPALICNPRADLKHSMGVFSSAIRGGPGIFTLQLQALAMLSQVTASRQGSPCAVCPSPEATQTLGSSAF